MKDKKNLFSLEKKVALVIGGQGKLGSEICLALSRQGAKVISASRSKNLKKDLSRKFENLSVEYIQMDASNEKEVKRIAKLIEKKYGNIDILVNSASWRPMNKFMKDSVKNWEKSLQVNGSSLFVPSRIIGEKMASNRKGSIINISSIYGLNAPPMSIYEGSDFITEPDYPFLKFGCVGLSKYLSSYFAKDNVRVNVIAPGGIENDQSSIFKRKYNKMTPMGKMASADDITGSVIFLASDQSKYITGVVLPVDGGWSSV